MRRRTAMLLGLAVCAGSATALAPLASANTAYPPPCPVESIVHTQDGNVYYSVPVPVGCTHVRGEVPVSTLIAWPPPPRTGGVAYPPEPCPPEAVLTQYDGNYYVTSPGIGSTCTRVRVEIPGSIKRP